MDVLNFPDPPFKVSVGSNWGQKGMIATLKSKEKGRIIFHMIDWASTNQKGLITKNEGIRHILHVESRDLFFTLYWQCTTANNTACGKPCNKWGSVSNHVIVTYSHGYLQAKIWGMVWLRDEHRYSRKVHRENLMMMVESRKINWILRNKNQSHDVRQHRRCILTSWL